MEQLVPILLGLVFGAIFGNLRSRSVVFTDIFFLVVWGVFVVLNPSYFLGSCIVGYLAGWGFRFARQRQNQSNDGNGQG